MSRMVSMFSCANLYTFPDKSIFLVVLNGIYTNLHKKTFCSIVVFSFLLKEHSDSLF